jgi:hypothetical protein
MQDRYGLCPGSAFSSLAPRCLELDSLDAVKAINNVETRLHRKSPQDALGYMAPSRRSAVLI